MTDTPDVCYEYSRGDLLEERNTYFYTLFQGKAFLAAWRHSRQSAAAGLSEPRPFEFKKVPFPDENENIIDTDRLLNHLGHLLSEDVTEPSEYQWALMNRLVTKFEVSKRIYGSYTKEFKSIEKADYKHLVYKFING